jgi:tetratricopeptide (TPR) repeat protein
MNKPQAPNPSKSPQPVRAQSTNAAAAAAWDGQKQLAGFEAAMKQFHARNFKPARELFEQAAQGPERDVAQRAKLHISMCDRRLLRDDGISLASAEEYYTYGIAMLNTRKFAEARTSLEKAVSMDPAADHMHYALAGALALMGDVNGAHERLKTAIEMEPRNRIAARQDADFASLANQPPFDTLLYPEKKSW